MSSSPHILVIGFGAIGAFFASRLASVPGVRVSAICRSNYKIVKENGIRVTSPTFKEVVLRPTYTFANNDEAREQKQKDGIVWSHLLVTTKVLPELGDPAALLDGLVDSGTAIVIPQNGLGIEEPYHTRFPNNPIISATTRTSAIQSSPGYVEHKHWTRTTIGPFARPDGSDLATLRTAEFVDLLHQADIPDIDHLDHIGMQFARWHKTAINAALNPTGVLARGSNSVSPTNNAMGIDLDVCEHMKAVMKEVLHAATVVLGKPLPDSLPSVEDVFEGVKADQSGSKPSMWVDWEAGRRVEVEAILGEPVRRAREVGVEVPRTESMYALLKMAQGLRLGDESGGA
ncbi:2-dehydropantoate 2-reductase [Fulvia fulva]|uniref:2-dehydropantoate 2-reductase n=1 Tax=Passalora fulva TaxID=5499 RepID=A0A9Q8PIH3_PASFU|nr:2-dehydropantoate 2-reductase [Fulvia fulva]KAK4617297.1 hypothetical protein CLAFUR0_09927 [Fulvia fulva]UJO23136.1 2-dehydropantoate 2-reductase [Fulvia fulva]